MLPKSQKIIVKRVSFSEHGKPKENLHLIGSKAGLCSTASIESFPVSRVKRNHLYSSGFLPTEESDVDVSSSSIQPVFEHCAVPIERTALYKTGASY